MVAQEEWILEPIYIKNHDIYKMICQYFPSTGKVKELLRDDIPNIKLSRGYYININDVLIGIFATKYGPVLFRNNKQFLLKQYNYKMELESSFNSKIFKLIINDEKKFVVKYPKQKYVNFDVWTDEESVDLFLWLYKNQNKDDFHNFYIV